MRKRAGNQHQINQLKIINICDSIDAILRVTNNSQPVQDIQETRGWIRDAVRDIIHEAFCDTALSKG